MHINRLLHELINRARYRISLRHVEKENPILVYQMGKVGSSTVVSTLRKIDTSSAVLHLHTLSKENLNRAIRRQRSSKRWTLHEHLIVSSMLVRKLDRTPFPCRVITLTREPISRAISFLLEDRVKQAPDAIRADGTLDIIALTDALNDLLEGDNGISDPTHWFNSEIGDVLGFNVFSVPYDFQRGYSIFEKEQISVLVIRMEDLNRGLLPALRELFGEAYVDLKIHKANVGVEKMYADELQTLKSTYRLPHRVIERITSTTYFSHFYSDSREEVFAQWAR